MTPRSTGLALAGCGAAFLVFIVLGLRTWPGGVPGWMPDKDMGWYVGYALAAGVPYAGAVWLARHRPLPRAALPGIVALGVLARLLVLAHVPVLSTDIFRYVWDGRVQAAGINPYRYFPADPALAAAA